MPGCAPTPSAGSPGTEVPVYKRLGITIVAGSGMNVLDSDGREYLDFYGGHAAALLGYAHPRLLAVLAEQAATLFFQTNLVDLPVRAAAVQALASIAPPGLSNVFFVNTGAEANENALRIACRATGRSRVIALRSSFHGRSAASAACSWGASASWYGFPRSPFDVTYVVPDDVDGLCAAMNQDVAAVILEPVQGLAGARDLAPDFVRAARAATRDAEALLIADEVQCGMGRSGHAFAVMASGVEPDLLTVAKGVAGGFPAGAVLMSDDLAATLKPGDLGTTFGGGPMACALIAAVVDELLTHDLIARAARLSDLIRSLCRTGPVQEIQGMGLLLGLRTGPPAAQVLAELRARGILAGGAADPHIVRIMPPLIVEEPQVRALAAALEGIPA